MDKAEGGLAGPAITPAPHPRDLARKLEIRQAGDTCGWVGGIETSGITCPAGSVCAQNTLYNAAFCCDAALFPYCGTFPTTCLDSTDVISRCTGLCLYNPAVFKCNLPGAPYCATKKFSQSTLNTFVTGYACSATPVTVTAYDYFTSGGRTIRSGANSIASDTLIVTSTVTGSGPTGTSAPGSTSRPSPTPSKSGLSAGAIAGIVIGGIAGILILIGMIFLYRYFRKQQDHRHQMSQPATSTTGPSMVQQNLPPQGPPQGPSQGQPQGPMGQIPAPVPFTDPSRPSYYSHTSGGAAIPPPQSDIGPDDSASQIGGPSHGSGLSQNALLAHDQAQQSHSSAQSGLGPLPQFQQNNPGLYAPGPQSSVAGGGVPGSAFSSLPGVAAPDIPSPGQVPLPMSPPPQQGTASPPQSTAGGASSAYFPPPTQSPTQSQLAPQHYTPPPQQQGYAPPPQGYYPPPGSPPVQQGAPGAYPAPGQAPQQGYYP